MVKQADTSDLKSDAEKHLGSTPSSGTIYYRYEELWFAESGIHLWLREYKVIKHTPKGVWLLTGYETKRLVLHDAYKRYACPTKEEALISFRARKKRQIRILSGQLARATLALQAEPNE